MQIPRVGEVADKYLLRFASLTRSANRLQYSRNWLTPRIRGVEYAEHRGEETGGGAYFKDLIIFKYFTILRQSLKYTSLSSPLSDSWIPKCHAQPSPTIQPGLDEIHLG